MFESFSGSLGTSSTLFDTLGWNAWEDLANKTKRLNLLTKLDDRQITHLKSVSAKIRRGETDPVQFKGGALFACKNVHFASSFLLLGIGPL